MVTMFLRQDETGKQVLLSFPATTPAEKADVAATMESLKSMSKTVTIQGAASEVMNLGLYLSGVDLAAEGELKRINQLAERLEHMSEVDCDKFAGMLDANKISGTKDILQLTEHLDDYVRAGLFAAASMTIPTSLAEKAGRSFLRGAGRAVNAALKSLHIFLERRYSHRCLSVEVTLSMLAFR